MSRSAINQPLTCPKSGQLLGAFVSLLRLDDPAVGGDDAARHLDRAARPAREYFAGEWVNEDRRQEICGWIAEALVRSGILGDIKLPSSVPGYKPPVAPMLTATIYAWLCRWDSVFHTTAMRWPHADQVMGGFVLGRQVVIDLALRWAAVIYLTGEMPPDEDASRWDSASGGAVILKRLLDRHAPGHKLDEYARMFDVDPRTLDRWLQRDDPLIPSEANVAAIARGLAKEANVAPEPITLQMRRDFALFSVARELARHIGWQWTAELVKGLVRLMRTTLAVFGQEPSLPEFLRNQGISFMNGIAFPPNSLVLQDWLTAEESPFWRDDIQAAAEGRLADRLTGCFRTIATWHSEPEPEMLVKLAPDAETRRDLHEFAVLWAMNDNRATPEALERAARKGQSVSFAPAANDEVRISNRTQQAMVCFQHGDFDGSIEHLKRLVELAPSHAKVRFFYGAALWQANQLRDNDLAVQQLEESCRLAPDWDRPFVEIAIIRVNRGLPDMALAHLLTRADEFRSRSDHFNWHEGVALRLLGHLLEALQAFERATSLNPNHGPAFDLAADCAFRLKDKVKGRRYAKRAFDLGCPGSINRYGV